MSTNVSKPAAGAGVGKPAFVIALMQELMGDMINWYGPDNWDAERFGAYKSSLKGSLLANFNKLFSSKVAIVPSDVSQQLQNVSRLEGSLGELSALYELLADDHSKAMLVKVIAYRILGHKKAKLPLNSGDYWSERESARSLIKSGETVSIKFKGWKLNHFGLDAIGYPLELYFLPGGVFVTFMLKQYEYGKRNPAIKAEEGDYVIDGGGCWGDTALYFAHAVGARGKVYTFEFTPENMEVMERNLSLNPGLGERVEIVPRALWDTSDEVLNYSSNGPGSSLLYNQQESCRVSTLSIDELVRRQHLPKVDFIKMDIEGAELKALHGARETIRTFKPKLAISLYHRETDLVDIPNYLDGLGVGYDFFLDHFTIYGEETILFASPKVN
ncbi:MAG: FkbM family methyltransferase [Acidobacteria bacterium]|nr:FkbM family methyltransferase [Acidobacteriota bacterium]MCA1640412.1 FkbM family methyltransferase [Acidobacteriota bacterium]